LAEKRRRQEEKGGQKCGSQKKVDLLEKWRRIGCQKTKLLTLKIRQKRGGTSLHKIWGRSEEKKGRAISSHSVGEKAIRTSKGYAAEDRPEQPVKKKKVKKRESREKCRGGKREIKEVRERARKGIETS